MPNKHDFVVVVVFKSHAWVYYDGVIKRDMEIDSPSLAFNITSCDTEIALHSVDSEHVKWIYS